MGVLAVRCMIISPLLAGGGKFSGNNAGQLSLTFRQLSVNPVDFHDRGFYHDKLEFMRILMKLYFQLIDPALPPDFPITKAIHPFRQPLPPIEFPSKHFNPQVNQANQSNFHIRIIARFFQFAQAVFLRFHQEYSSFPGWLGPASKAKCE